MKRKKIGWIFMLLLVMVLTSCGSSNRQAYDKNLALWKSKNIQHYRFDLKIGCFCPWTDLMPLKVEVRNGEAVSIAASNGGDISPYLRTFRPNSTIQSLFDIVYAAITRGADSLTVQYDGTYGFPASVDIDPSRKIMDDETSYYITNFEVLP